MSTSRRNFVKQSLAGAAALGLTAPSALAEEPNPKPPVRRTPIAVSTYSFWRFRDDSKLSIGQCIDEAAKMGFDGVEILLVQLQSQLDAEGPACLQRLKQQAFVNGLDLFGFSTHQGFVYPDAQKRQQEVEKTIGQIELAYELGIPTMRVNTGLTNRCKRGFAKEHRSWLMVSVNGASSTI